MLGKGWEQALWWGMGSVMGWFGFKRERQRVTEAH